MAARAVDHLPQARGGGKPKKKSSVAERSSIREIKEIGKFSTIQGTDPNSSRQIARDYRRQLNAQAAASARDIIDLECSGDELRQTDKSSFNFGKVVHQTTYVHVIDLDSSEDEESVAVNSKFASGAIVKPAEHIDVIDLESSEDEMPTGVEVEFVTLDALHYDNMFASKEGVCFDHGTIFDNDVLGDTMESISKVSSFAEKDQSQIGVADDNEDVEVDLNYEVDEEGEAEDDIESLDEKDLSETEFRVTMVNVVAFSLLISALISVLIGSTASSYVKKGNNSTLNLGIPICQQALTNKQFNASPDVPCSTMHIFQDIPSSWNWIEETWDSNLCNLQKSSSYCLIGLDASAKHEIQQKRGATAECQQPLLTKNLNTSLIMPVSTKHNIYRRSTTIEINTIKNEHGNYEFVAPQWAQRLYGSFTPHETYPIKNKHADEEAITPKSHNLYGNSTTENISNQEYYS